MKIQRWIVLLILAVAGFTEYYVYDSITSVDYLLKSSLGFSSEEFGLLYSFYSVANVFFLALFFAGILVDHWGYQKSGLLFVFLCLLGASMTAWGASPNLIPAPLNQWLSHTIFPGYSAELKIMLVGRMIFGMGAEALLVAIMKALVGWFGERHIAFALALAIVVYRFGTFLSLNLQIKVALKYSLQTALWFAAAIMLIGCLAFIVYLVMDKLFKHNETIKVEEEEKFRLRDISHFPFSFWLLTLVCISFYGVVTSFEIFDPDILKNRFGVSPQRAGFLASIMLIGPMVLMPILGYVVDHYGKRATFMITGSALGVLALFFFIGVKIPEITISIMGVAYSLIGASLWATVPLLVDKRCQGTAFGILSYIQNMGLMLFPWLTGYIADLYTKTVPKQEAEVNYLPVLIFFIIVMVASLVFSILLKASDKHSIDEGSLSLEQFKD